VDMAIMFITHNLGVVAEMAEEINVMYMGKVVERADTVTLFYEAKHPYSIALLQSIPRIGQKISRLAVIEGMVPDPFNLPSGCLFHPRCPEFMPGTCDVNAPGWKKVGPHQWVSCWLYE
jgi:peptide/nickel transport system ATP-binding protein